jgi:Lon protease-like protein
VPGPLLALFPLRLVLFPQTPLPLHIFEERYREMIGEAIRSGTEFGVVQGSDEGIVNTGCTASIDRVLRRYEDGRLDILCMGRRRFEVISVDQERSFLRGVVEYFDDEDEAPSPLTLRREAIQAFERLRAVSEAEVLGEPDEEDDRLSFQLAQLIPDLDFRQILLATRSEAERLQQIRSFIPKYLEAQKRALHIKKVAPLNGHAHGQYE